MEKLKLKLPKNNKKEPRSITVSITLPKQLNKFIQKKLDTAGLSRSRFITNILLDWQKKQKKKKKKKFKK